MLQFLRKVRFRANGLVINGGDIQPHELKIAFDVSKSISSTQNGATIKIWNLSKNSRSGLGKELNDVILEAGYMPPGGGSNVGIIFAGQIRDVQHTRDGADIITEMTCGDGDRAFRRAVTSKAFPKGTPVPEVVEELYSQLAKQGVKRGEWKFPDDIGDKAFKRPYAMCGGCKQEMDHLSRGKGFYWSVQNGAMEIIPADGYLSGVVLISPQTGMVDTPTITDNGVKVRTLLNPEIRPNRRVQVESETLEMNAENGLYRVSQVTFSGDNRDGDFIADVHGESVQGGKIDQGFLQ